MLVTVLVALTVLTGAALAVALHAAASRYLVLVIVDGLSMAPAYRSGDRVLVLRRNGRRVRRGRVVVIEQPELEHGWDRLPPPDGALAGRSWYLKRVAAVAGDPVPPAVTDAVAHTVAQKVAQKVAQEVPDSAGDTPIRVPPDMLVVLGDGQRSDDSRQWGYFPADRVLGVVIRRLR